MLIPSCMRPFLASKKLFPWPKVGQSAGSVDLRPSTARPELVGHCGKLPLEPPPAVRSGHRQFSGCPDRAVDASPSLLCWLEMPSCGPRVGLMQLPRRPYKSEVKVIQASILADSPVLTSSRPQVGLCCAPCWLTWPPGGPHVGSNRCKLYLPKPMLHLLKIKSGLALSRPHTKTCYAEVTL